MEVVFEHHIAEHAVRNGLLDFAHDREQQLLRLFRFQNRLTLETDGSDEYRSVRNKVASDVAHALDSVR